MVTARADVAPSTCVPIGTPHELPPVRPVDWVAAVLILLFLAVLWLLARRHAEDGPN